MDDKNETINAFCPKCNRNSTLGVRATANGSAPQEIVEQLDGSEDGLHSTTFRIAFCGVCASVFLHASSTSEPSDIPYESMLFPQVQRRSIPALPPAVHRTYLSATSCFDTGHYEPSVIMCRKCVELVAAHWNQRDGDLKSRLVTLKNLGRLEPRLFEWADQLRLLGNEAAHSIDSEITKDDAIDCLEFLEAFLLNALVLEDKLHRFRARRQRQ